MCKGKGHRILSGAVPQHLIRSGEVLVLARERLGVEAVVGDHGEQRVEHRAGQVAPVVDVAELPPPQRLGDVTERW